MVVSGSAAVEEAGDRFEDLLQASEGANVAIARGALRQSQQLGGLLVGQLLEVSQGDDFPIQRLHLVEGGLELELQLGTDDLLTDGGHSSEELPREGDGAGMG